MKKWFWDNKKPILFVLGFFLFWQILMASLIWWGEKFVPSTNQDVYVEQEKIVNPPIFWSRANFDGMHYLDIARKGYDTYQQAFFPLYPGLIKFLSPYFSGKALMTGLAISWLSFLVTLFLFYKLVRLDFEERITTRSLLYLLLFPTAFFFFMVYNESLFLFLVLGSFYTARRGKWWLAGILGAFASATRLVGIFLLPALLWEWWEQQRNFKFQISNFKFLASALPIFLVPAGLLFYMRFLAINYQDPLMFLHVDKIILLHQVFWRYFKMIATTKLDPLYFTVWLEFLTAMGSLVLLIFAYFKKVRSSYLLFAALAYIAPTLTGTFSSMPRYVLVLFPCFITLSLIENRFFRWALVFVSFLLFAVATIFFTRGYRIG